MAVSRFNREEPYPGFFLDFFSQRSLDQPKALQGR
jgi:hypothetical protein